MCEENLSLVHTRVMEQLGLQKLYFKPKKCLTSTSLLVLYSSVLLLHDRSLLGLLGSRKIGLPSAWPPPLL